MKPASPLGRFAAWLAVAGMLVGPGFAPVSVAADVLPKVAGKLRAEPPCRL